MKGNRFEQLVSTKQITKFLNDLHRKFFRVGIHLRETLSKRPVFTKSEAETYPNCDF